MILDKQKHLINKINNSQDKNKKNKITQIEIFIHQCRFLNWKIMVKNYK